MTTMICRRFTWSAGHRIVNGGKCARLHGHNYVARVYVAAEQLDERGMVVDFDVVKNVMAEWIDQNWDHRLLLDADDGLAGAVLDSGLCPTVDQPRFASVMSDYIVASSTLTDGPPTAENMARWLYDVACARLPSTVDVVRVEVEETENCSAAYPVRVLAADPCGDAGAAEGPTPPAETDR